MMAGDQSSALRILGGLLEARTGQQLVAGRQWRIETALKPVARSLGLDGVDALVAKLVSGKEEALATQVVEALLNNETSFFRDPGVFDLLNSTAFDRLRSARRDTKRLRIWSAGCSTGQEPYSLAIQSCESEARWAGWSIDLSATDVSEAAIARARRGRYSQFEIQRGLPVRTMLRWFEQDGEDWVVDNRLRRMIRFATHSLTTPPPGQYDVILCRNVLMYFAPPVRRAVFERLHEALAPDGVLMLGAGETVIGQTTRFAADPALRGLYAVHERTANPQRRVA
jgi:chemotaxis protein methyltransferase CheR